MRDSGFGTVRERLLKKDGFWKEQGKAGEYVRMQLVAEQQSRRDAEQEAKIAKAEAAAAIARVEAMRAATAARELEIEAAAARLVAKQHPVVRDEAPGAPPGGRDGAIAVAAAQAAAARQSSGADVARQRKRHLVERLEVTLLEKLDQRSPSDSESARALVLRRVFRSAPVGGPRSATHATRAEFHDGLALLGLPQSATSVQAKFEASRPKPAQETPLPLGEEAEGAAPRPPPPRAAVESDAAIDRAVVDALFDKYAEVPPVRLVEQQARYEREAAEKVVDFSTLYGRISKAAVRPGSHRAPSLAMAQANYMAKLKGHGHGASGGGGVFDSRRDQLSRERWAQARGAAGETRRGVPGNTIERNLRGM